MDSHGARSQREGRGSTDSLPWQLRSVTVGNAVRSDTSIALHKDAAGNSGNAVACVLLATNTVTPEIAPPVRPG